VGDGTFTVASTTPVAPCSQDIWLAGAPVRHPTDQPTVQPVHRAGAKPRSFARPTNRVRAGPQPGPLKTTARLESFALEEWFPRTPQRNPQIQGKNRFLHAESGQRVLNHAPLQRTDDAIHVHLYSLSGFHLWIFQLGRRHSFQVCRPREKVEVWSCRGWGRDPPGGVRRILPAPTLPSDTEAFSPTDRHPAQEEPSNQLKHWLIKGST